MHPDIFVKVTQLKETSSRLRPRPTTILLVCRDADIRIYCRRVFECHNKRVLTANTVTEAAQAMENTVFDAVLCDQKLSEGNGLEFHAQLKEQGRPEAERFVLIVNEGEDGLPPDVKVIEKPFDFATLMYVTHQVIWAEQAGAARAC